MWRGRAKGALVMNRFTTLVSLATLMAAVEARLASAVSPMVWRSSLAG